MNHQQIQEDEVIEQYVLQKLPPAERQAFQEHYFVCDECFEQVNTAARFIAGVRQASESGVLAADPARAVPFPTRSPRAVITPGWAPNWAMAALAACLLVSFTLVGLLALSLKRQNQMLVQRPSEPVGATERRQKLEARIRELEAGDSASQAQKQTLQQEIDRLKGQLKATEQQRETQIAELRRPEIPDVNVPVRNVYPVGGAERSAGSSEINRLNLPRGTRTLVLILSDYKAGSSAYRLEVRDAAGRLVATRAGMKPDQNGELSVLLNRTLLRQGQYRLKLYGQGKAVAEYLVQVD